MRAGWAIGAMIWCTGASGQGFNCDTPATPTLPNPTLLGNGSAGSVSRAQLQAALDAGGDIRLNIGASTITLDATLQITRAVRLDGNGATLSGASARRVIEIRNPTLATYDILLKNLILRDGDARGAAGNEFARSGGAILNDHGGEPWRAVGLQAFDVQFIGNRGIDVAQDGGGGAVYPTGHREFVCVRCRFENNQGANGGGVYNLGTQAIRFYDSVFSANSASPP